MKVSDFLVLKERVQEERANAARLMETLQTKGYLNPTSSLTLTKELQDEFHLRAVASVLLDYYSVAENIFKEIAKRVDGTLPKGDEWHKDLLQQMKFPLPGIRPPVLSPESFARLDEYRKFCHLVRHIYGFNLVPTKLLPLVDSLPETDQAFAADLQGFLNAMEGLLGYYS
ncbi:hypothetical protein [Gelria sp. Kuro-4]|uniref:ribonuclease toxin HepT-like protein n=1 Tax=Gelria sp. Kuro-4 TaxID=2796927 RepID=UPI001BEE8F77|nr:hypothetical protein [Gelria sp. Kuro-4]BCV26021.1 hypothetical protein kuro4_27940 [Gelria sp. Kuro-4]